MGRPLAEAGADLAQRDLLAAAEDRRVGPVREGARRGVVERPEPPLEPPVPVEEPPVGPVVGRAACPAWAAAARPAMRPSTTAAGAPPRPAQSPTAKRPGTLVSIRSPRSQRRCPKAGS